MSVHLSLSFAPSFDREKKREILSFQCMILIMQCLNRIIIVVRCQNGSSTLLSRVQHVLVLNGVWIVISLSLLVIDSHFFSSLNK